MFIMHDFKALCRQAHTLVIFKSLHEVPVFEKLLDTLAVCESDSDKAIEKYSDFVAELFAYSDNLTEYMTQKGEQLCQGLKAEYANGDHVWRFPQVLVLHLHRRTERISCLFTRKRIRHYICPNVPEKTDITCFSIVRQMSRVNEDFRQYWNGGAHGERVCI